MRWLPIVRTGRLTNLFPSPTREVGPVSQFRSILCHPSSSSLLRRCLYPSFLRGWGLWYSEWGQRSRTTLRFGTSALSAPSHHLPSEPCSGRLLACARGFRLMRGESRPSGSCKRTGSDGSSPSEASARVCSRYLSGWRYSITLRHTKVPMG